MNFYHKLIRKRILCHIKQGGLVPVICILYLVRTTWKICLVINFNSFAKDTYA